MSMGESRTETIALAHRARVGDNHAFAALYQRFAPFARRTASRIVSDPHEVDDLVHEAFYVVLRSMRAGGGPTESFAGYVVSTVRRLAIRHANRQRRVVPTEDVDRWDDVVAESAGSRQLDDVAVAWAGLPHRWRGILWSIEVDRYSPTELAPALDMSPTAVSSLASRARDALRTAYLAQRVTGDEPDACANLLPRLAAFARGTLAGRWLPGLAEHVRSCPACRDRLHDLVVHARRLPVR